MIIHAEPSTFNPGSIVVWWTPDCGYLHVETDPPSIGTTCPDGVQHWSAETSPGDLLDDDDEHVELGGEG